MVLLGLFAASFQLLRPIARFLDVPLLNILKGYLLLVGSPGMRQYSVWWDAIANKRFQSQRIDIDEMHC